jgi:hypothetical protein
MAFEGAPVNVAARAIHNSRNGVGVMVEWANETVKR